MNRAQLQSSRKLWVDREKKAKLEAAHAHRMHKLRASQLEKLVDARVSTPMRHITTDTWGYHPGVHDGVDLICPASEPLLAICRSTVVRADAGGWWGKGAPSDPALKARGDGIIVLRSLVDAGPIKRGMNLCYGHAEHATVKVGQVMQPGDTIGNAGFANAWHVHFMVNMRTDAKGVGDRDPRPVIDYARNG